MLKPSSPRLFEMIVGVTQTDPSKVVKARTSMEKAALSHMQADLHRQGYKLVRESFSVAWDTATTGKASCLGIPIAGHSALNGEV